MCVKTSAGGVLMIKNMTLDYIECQNTLDIPNIQGIKSNIDIKQGTE